MCVWGGGQSFNSKQVQIAFKQLKRKAKKKQEKLKKDHLIRILENLFLNFILAGRISLALASPYSLSGKTFAPNWFK